MIFSLFFSLSSVIRTCIYRSSIFSLVRSLSVSVFLSCMNEAYETLNWLTKHATTKNNKTPSAEQKHKENMFDTRRKIRRDWMPFHAANGASERRRSDARLTRWDSSSLFVLFIKMTSERSTRDTRMANEPRDLNMTGAKNNQDSFDSNERW